MFHCNITEPIIKDTVQSLDLDVINDAELLAKTTIVLPNVTTENGPFRLVNISLYVATCIYYSLHSHLYIVVIKSDVLSSTKRMINNAEHITTQQLLEESVKDVPSYYIAAVVNASQYRDGFRMGYVLGAEDYTTDADGHSFYNRKLINGLEYFFRVFSISSTPEVCKLLNFFVVFYTLVFCSE